MNAPLKLPRYWITLALAVLIFYTFYRAIYLAITPPGMIPNDFSVFFHTVERFIAGSPVYQPDDPSPYKYSPTFLLFIRYSIWLFSKQMAWAIWCILSIVLFASTTQWLWQVGISRSERSRLSVAGLVIAFTIFGWHGYLEHFSYGQADYIVFSLFLLSIRFAESTQKRGQFLAALFMALLLTIKIQAGILLAYFALRNKWGLLTKIILGFIFLLALPIGVWGPTKQLSLFAEWKHGLSRQSIEFLTGNLNQSLAASLSRLLSMREQVSSLIWIIVGLAAGAVGYFSFSKRTDFLREKEIHPTLFTRLACVVLALYLVSNPISWRWLTFMWMPLGLLIGYDALIGLRKNHSFKSSIRILIAMFSINGLLLQKIIANALGIPEVDELSFIGLYCFGNCLLLASSLLACRSYSEPSL